MPVEAARVECGIKMDVSTPHGVIFSPNRFALNLDESQRSTKLDACAVSPSSLATGEFEMAAYAACTTHSTDLNECYM